MKVACVLVDHFPFKLEAKRQPSLLRHPVIIVQRHGSQSTVLDVSPAVQGIAPGMSLQEAQTHCKGALPVEADLPFYQRAFSRMVSRLGDRSPVVEPAGLGCVYVGLDGLEQMYCGEARLIDVLLKAIPAHLTPCLGVSQGKFPAYLAALTTQPGRAYKPDTEVTQFVASFPVDVLPVSWEVKRRLHRFGIHTLGEVARLSIGPL